MSSAGRSSVFHSRAAARLAAAPAELDYRFKHVFGSLTIDRWNLTRDTHDPLLECYYQKWQRDPRYHDFEHVLAKPYVALVGHTDWR